MIIKNCKSLTTDSRESHENQLPLKKVMFIKCPNSKDKKYAENFEHTHILCPYKKVLEKCSFQPELPPYVVFFICHVNYFWTALTNFFSNFPLSNSKANNILKAFWIKILNSFAGNKMQVQIQIIIHLFAYQSNKYNIVITDIYKKYQRGGITKPIPV